MLYFQGGKPNPAFINDEGSKLDLRILEQGLSPKVFILFIYK